METIQKEENLSRYPLPYPMRLIYLYIVLYRRKILANYYRFLITVFGKYAGFIRDFIFFLFLAASCTYLGVILSIHFNFSLTVHILITVAFAVCFSVVAGRLR